MSLISLRFFVFAIITLVVYFILPKKYRWIVLLFASLYFYLEVGKRALLTLILAAMFTFFAGIFIEKSPVEAKKRRVFFSVATIVVIGWLTLTKISTYCGWDYRFLVVPLGTSYITFSLISYLVDIYWEKDTADKNFFKFLLYVLFFPKISQGPITRHEVLSNKMYEGGTLSYDNLCFGSQRMIYGYFKKIVLADRAAMLTNTVFTDISQFSGSIIVVASILAALELYCDFSGYMDIVLGYTQMLGLEMDENFKHPFFSKSAAEFWRRWHITLGSWFKDYVYTPIVMSQPVKKIGRWSRKNIGKRFGNSLMKVIALSAVWMLTGLWHGTGINYILWGAMWGVIIIFSTIFEDEIKKVNKLLHINTDASSWKLFQMIRTSVIFCTGILIARLTSLYQIKDAARLILGHFRFVNLIDGTLFNLGLDKINFNIMALGFLLILVISILQEQKSVRTRISELNAPIRWFIYAFGISLVIFLGIYGEGYTTAGFAYTHF